MEDEDPINDFLALHGYKKVDFIGKGSFSSVYLVFSAKYNSNFALKKTILASDVDNGGTDAEIDSLLRLNHPNIIRIYDWFRKDNILYSVFEYCPNGSIGSIVGRGLPKNIFMMFAKQLLEALNFCHKNGVAHRDIKPANIFLDMYNRPKLADFGLSFRVSKGSNHNFAGSLAYMAPEIVSQVKADPYKADIWSLGITFYYLLCGRTPWGENTAAVIQKMIQKGEIFYPEEINRDLQHFIESMLRFTPDERPSCQKLLDSLEKISGGKCNIIKSPIGKYSTFQHSKSFRYTPKIEKKFSMSNASVKDANVNQIEPPSLFPPSVGPKPSRICAFNIPMGNGVPKKRRRTSFTLSTFVDQV